MVITIINFHFKGGNFMHQARQIIDDIYYIGASDRRLNLFENIHPVPDGMSYNSYVVLDEKTVLLDTVDKAISKVFLENLDAVLNGRKLDYIVINHMEPDHTATLAEVFFRHPEATLVGNTKTFSMMKQFFDMPIDGHTLVVKEGDTLNTGKHTFSFHLASMLHWHEVMVTFDTTYKALFSADAFGTFGALNGNIFSDEFNFETEWLSEARRYYTNIVGKYGVQTQALLKKAAPLDVEYLCPLHGPVWRDKEKIAWFIDKYSKWSSYTPEDNDVVIFYGSIYGNTEDAANFLANELGKKGVRNIKVFDVSTKDPSYLIGEAFRAKVFVFACSTYNAEIFPKMEDFLLELKGHNMQNRDVAILENGSWALLAGKKIKEILSTMKNINLIGDSIAIKSALKEEQLSSIEKMAEDIKEALEK